MTTNTDRIVENLHQIVSELEAVTRQARGLGKRMDGRLEDAAAGLDGALNAVRRRVGDLRGLERRVRRTAKAANHFVRENRWRALAATAAAAMVVGFALARGFTSPASTSQKAEPGR